ncbi:MAG: PQQ-binding-like beta-propeller repeat protein, partial [Candidatus Firestonebacteria bacterium]
FSFSVLAQETPAVEVTAEIKPPAIIIYTAKEAKAEVIKALRAKYIDATEIGKYYEQIDSGKIAEVIKKLDSFKPNENAVLGSANYMPSPEHPSGWRGDGNGRYPAAEPPLTWGRNSKASLELRTQAKNPGSGDKGNPLTDGVIRDWLLLGPADASKYLGKETGWKPDEGQKAEGLEWKAFTTDTSWVNFWPLYGKDAQDMKNTAAYAHAWIYSPGESSVYLQTMFSGKSKIWLNGKEIGSYVANGTRRALVFQGGWNSLLFRVSPIDKTDWSRGVVQWHFSAAFFGQNPVAYESRNILWSTPLPDFGPGVGSPLIVGEKVFLQAEPSVLLCLRKKDGKPLWAASNTFADAATSAERKANAEVFSEADDLNAKIKNSLAIYCSAPEKYPDRKDRGGLESKLNLLMLKVDPEKYYAQSGSEAGQSAQTPASDGENLYAVFGSGVVVCYDFEGKRKWITVVGVKNSEHGYAASPYVIDGKVVVKSSKYLGAVELDCKTGAEVKSISVWKKAGLNMYATPLEVSLGKEKLIALSFGVVARVRDGKVLAQDFLPPYYNIPDFVSPVIEGRVICSIIIPPWDGNIKFGFQTLPDYASDPLKMKDIKTCTYDVKKFPCWFSYDHCASPLLYQGLAYILSVDGVLTVIDAAKAEVVYQKMLDFSPYMVHNGVVRTGCSTSPTLAGKYIYLWDNQGTTVVIEPGRTFKQVARNRIEQLYYAYGTPKNNENTASNPVFDGKLLFYRGQTNLYCIGETGKK